MPPSPAWPYNLFFNGKISKVHEEGQPPEDPGQLFPLGYFLLSSQEQVFRSSTEGVGEDGRGWAPCSME